MLRTFCHARWDRQADRKPAREDSRCAIPADLAHLVAATSCMHPFEREKTMTVPCVERTAPSPQPPLQAPQPPLQSKGGAAEGRAAIDTWGRLPLAMRERPQWCLGGPNKQPLTTAGGPAKVNDPKTWTDFESVTAAARRTGRPIGYVITADDGLTCVDLDVKEGVSPEVIARHAAIIETLDSYTERSLSGRGWHVWVYGETGAGRRRDSVEVYSQDRFIICTGDIYRDRPIVGRQTELSNMLAQMPQSSAAPVVLVGDDCVDWSAAAYAAADKGELGRLFRGDWTGRYESQSEADLALVKLLVPLTLSEMECWRTFQQSRLGQRDKAKRWDYARATVGLALSHLANDSRSLRHGESLTEALMGQGARTGPSYFRLMHDDDFDSEPPHRWLVKGVLPASGIGAIFGESGTFKSFLALDLLASISNGFGWFGRKVNAAPAVYVPFEGQGGVPNRVRAWRLARAAQQDPTVLLAGRTPADVKTNVGVIKDPMSLRDPGDRDRLVRTLRESGWAGGVLCIDTLAHASSGLDENSSAMAEMITIFSDLQCRLGGLILLIHHSGKDQARGMRGWSGLHAAMDFVIECQRPKQAAKDEAQFVLTKVKEGESGVTHRFQMLCVPLGTDEDGDLVTSLVVQARADAPDSDRGDHPFALTDAELAAEDDKFLDQWIRELVTEGKRPTGRYLQSSKSSVAARRKMTQIRIREAVDRLKGEGRLVDEPNGPGGQKWLRPVDRP